MDDAGRREELLRVPGVRRAVEAAAALAGTPRVARCRGQGLCVWRGEVPGADVVAIDAGAGEVQVERWCPVAESERDSLVALSPPWARAWAPGDAPEPAPGDRVRWRLESTPAASRPDTATAFVRSLGLAPLLAPGLDDAARAALDELRATIRPEGLGAGTIRRAAFDSRRLRAPGAP